MAPKRRAASAVKAGGKKVKEEPETTKPKDAFTSAKEALLAAGPQVKSNRKVDENCSLSASGEVRSTVHTACTHSSVAINAFLSNLLYFVVILSTRYTRTMTVCSIRQTLGKTITSFMLFKLLKQATNTTRGTDGVEW